MDGYGQYWGFRAMMLPGMLINSQNDRNNACARYKGQEHDIPVSSKLNRLAYILESCVHKRGSFSKWGFTRIIPDSRRCWSFYM